MYIVRLRDNIHSEVSLLGDKIHYTVYSSTFGEVYAITTYYMDGFALMFPSTTLNSPLSIIYLGDPISLGIMTFSETIFPSLSLEKRLLLPQASFMLHPHPPQKTYGDYFS